MTREEAIFCEKSYIGETHCTDCKYYGTDTCKARESHKMAIIALEQDTVSKESYDHEYFLRKEFEVKIDKLERAFDKIKAEIEKLQKMCDKNDLNLMVQYSVFGMVLDIIQQYKTESEE